MRYNNRAILYRYSSLLDFHYRKLLCSSLVLPYIDYCSSSWYSCLTKKLRNRLDVLQRRVVRYIFSLAPRDHVGTEKLRELSWLSIPDRVRYFKICHVFRIRAGLAPDYLSTNFTPVSDTHGHNTRGSSLNYTIPSALSHCPTSFGVTAIKEWNLLPSELKDVRSFPAFRSKVKQWLSSEY